MSGATGRGGLPGYLTKLSKTLSYILRHGATKLGLELLPGGYLYVDDLLQLDQLKRFSYTDVQTVVDNNEKKRFHLEQEPSSGRAKIRANQGHSIEVNDLELTPIVDPGQFRNVVHGTFSRCWAAIKTQGLKTMGRTHIHFAPGEPGRDEVISGMRASCDVIIHINMEKAIADGLKFFLSANNVILSTGNDDGVISPEYFLRVFDRTTRRKLSF